MKATILLFSLLIASAYSASIQLTAAGLLFCADGCSLTALLNNPLNIIGGVTTIGAGDTLSISASTTVKINITSTLNIAAVALSATTASTLTFAAGTTATLSSTLDVTTGTVYVAGNLVVSGATTIATSGVFTVQANAKATFNGAVNLNGGSFTVSASGWASLGASSTLSGTVSLATNSVFIIQSGTTTVSQSLVASGNTTVVSVLKFTAGAYTQADGYLYLSSSSSSASSTQPCVTGDVTLSATATLRGNGNVTGNLILQSSATVGATLAVGNSPGTVYVDGDVTMSSLSTFQLDIASTNDYDRIIARGTVNLAGILYAHLDNYQPTSNEQYTFIVAGAATKGDFSVVHGDLTSNFGSFNRKVNANSVVAYYSHSAASTTVASLFLLAFVVVVNIL